MGIQINGQTDRITAVDGSFGIQDLAELNISGIVTAASANFTGNVSIGGTLTYQDVTNIDSVGIITARSGIHITGTDEELRIYRDQGDRFGGLRYTGSLFKLRLPAADHFTVDDSSNNERLRITSAGLVGVNCTPLSQFQVKSGTNQNIALSSMSSEASIEAYNDAGSA